MDVYNLSNSYNENKIAAPDEDNSIKNDLNNK